MNNNGPFQTKTWIEDTVSWIEDTVSWVEDTIPWIEDTISWAEDTKREKRKKKAFKKELVDLYFIDFSFNIDDIP